MSELNRFFLFMDVKSVAKIFFCFKIVPKRRTNGRKGKTFEESPDSVGYNDG